MVDINVDVDGAIEATAAVTASLAAFDIAATAAYDAHAALVPYNGSPEQAAWDTALIDFANAARQLVIDTGALNDFVVDAIGASIVSQSGSTLTTTTIITYVLPDAGYALSTIINNSVEVGSSLTLIRQTGQNSIILASSTDANGIQMTYSDGLPITHYATFEAVDVSGVKRWNLTEFV
jgi:hypothetical protein